MGARLTTSAGCSGPTAESSLVALVEEHHTAREVPGVLEVPSCTAEGGSLDRSPVAAGRSPEKDLHAAEVADHTAAEEAGRTAVVEEHHLRILEEVPREVRTVRSEGGSEDWRWEEAGRICRSRI